VIVTVKRPTLTTKEVAARLKLNPLTVQRWIRDGKIQAGRLPGRGGYRIPISEVERLERGG
jgi:excisionase family DNA binding protein